MGRVAVHVQERCTSTVKQAFSELRNDLDPLTAAAPALGAHLEAELTREQGAAPRPTLASTGQIRRAQRSVVAALLEHPLPVSAALLEVEEAEAAPLEGPSPSQGTALPAQTTGIASGGAVSQL